MSKSPKTLSTLASSLSLSTISRARSSGNAAATYTFRAADGRRCVVVTQRRLASNSATSTSNVNLPSSASSSVSPSTSVALTNRDNTGNNGLLRAASTSATSSRVMDRQMHSSSRHTHQQPMSSVSSLSSGITPPIGVGSSSSSSSSSSQGSTAEGGSAFHARPSVSSSEGSLLLTSQPGTHGNPSLATTLADPTSSSSSGSGTTSNTHSTSTDRATLFTAGAHMSFPNHSLPTFFGTSLNIARRSNLVFRNGAYGIPKARPDDKGKEKAVMQGDDVDFDLSLSVSVGEDAYFLRNDSLGVADGVGGWSRHAGANPARWSRKLMHHCSAELARYDNVEDELFLRYYEVDPVEVLQRAFEKSLLECKEEGIIGSSTALLAVLRNDELRLANMGDCSCSIIRGNDYIFRSEEQQHSFNYPVQAGTNSKDTPIKDAQRFNIKVQKDDIVILSSDGLLDNIFDGDLLEEVNRFAAASSRMSNSSGAHRPGARYTLNQFSPQVVSEALSRRAQSVYEDPHAVASPFQQRAVEEGIYFTGGKRDDITTLVGVVGELEASPDRR